MVQRRRDRRSTDPQFGLDTGFYLFAMPFYSALLGFVSAVLHDLPARDGARRRTSTGRCASASASCASRRPRASSSPCIAGLYLLVQGASLWLDRYKTLVEPGDRITGPGYTGVNAIIPGQTILAIVAVVVAILFFVTAIIGRWRYPAHRDRAAHRLGDRRRRRLPVGRQHLPGAAEPARPRERVLPAQHRHDARPRTASTASRRATSTPTTDAEAGQLREDAQTTAQIRIMDPAIISPTVRQLEQYRSYYQFKDPLDVDRYEIDGESQDTIVSVRELNVDQLGAATSWQNSTLVYTHGYGLVAAAGNERTTDGNPVFLERGIPATGFLSDERELRAARVLRRVLARRTRSSGAPEGTDPIELDYPSGDGRRDRDARPRSRATAGRASAASSTG